MDVYWLEQFEADVPAHDDWLSLREAACLRGMRVAKRRSDWRLGRWTAKQALAAYWRLANQVYTLSEIEIFAAASGAPQVFVSGRPAGVSISLSHSDGAAICAVTRSGAAVGCDLELIEPRSQGFITDYFTPEEQELVAGAATARQSQLATLLWSAKESALKAIGEGLRVDTRDVAVELLAMAGNVLQPAALSPDAPDCWQPLRVRCPEDRVFAGWWRHSDNLVRTLVAAPPTSPPVRLEVASRRTAPSDQVE
jgi:4'-phosphopantetheinyl transferase